MINLLGCERDQFFRIQMKVERDGIPGEQIPLQSGKQQISFVIDQPHRRR
jgi:hypothetical protein